MKSVSPAMSLASLILGLSLGTPVLAAITVQDDGSYLQTGASTGFGLIGGQPKVPLILSPIQKGKSPPSFHDSRTGTTTTLFSNAGMSGTIDVKGNVYITELGHPYLTASIRANAHALAQRAHLHFSAGAIATAVGKIKFTLSQLACYHMEGEVSSANEPGHSESSVSGPKGLPFRSFGKSTDLAFRPGPFITKGMLLPGNYTVVAKASEDQTLGRFGIVREGKSNAFLNLVVSEDCAQLVRWGKGLATDFQ